ncbi:MAG: tRNA (adenosine(37)-N6)-dimethylallyltransferase MiaA [Candidatus Rokubacteria bacterium]|nr:tRNA (adenosine(37)-N6)-dimethylallyltransferase MiaA [Candidatus Rokubacteria bacterium]
MDGSFPPLVVIAGPTGVGKTDVAVRLACRLPVEIVSADSRQVYRGMDIGTAKPTFAQREAVPHHLIDVVNPDERYHVARFSIEARRAVAAILERGKLPLVVGGTGLYIRALLRGLLPAPPANAEVRRELTELLRRDGLPALHARLRAVDAEASGRIHEHDAVRILRALEIHRLTGAPVGTPSHWRQSRPEWSLLLVGLTRPRSSLYAALGARVDAMVARGLREETRQLLAAGYDGTLAAMQGIGYRHFVKVLRGASSEAEAIRAMKRDTRLYAKRQWTWFAREPEIRWVDVEAAGGIQGTAERVEKWIIQDGLSSEGGCAPLPKLPPQGCAGKAGARTAAETFD